MLEMHTHCGADVLDVLVQPGRDPPDKEEGHEAAQEAGRRERFVEADSADGVSLQEEQEEGRAMKVGERSSHQRSKS
jgi:hypothetical protein